MCDSVDGWPHQGVDMKWYFIFVWIDKRLVLGPGYWILTTLNCFPRTADFEVKIWRSVDEGGALYLMISLDGTTPILVDAVFDTPTTSLVHLSRISTSLLKSRVKL
jgi:hypothetical protein